MGALEKGLCLPGFTVGFPGMFQSRAATLCRVTEPAVRAVCSITTGFCRLCGPSGHSLHLRQCPVRSKVRKI